MRIGRERINGLNLISVTNSPKSCVIDCVFVFNSVVVVVFVVTVVCKVVAEVVAAAANDVV